MNSRPLHLALTIAAALLLLVGGPWLLSQLKSLPGAGELAARSGQRIVMIAVDNLRTQADCERVRSVLAATPGVRTCEVRLGQQRAFVIAESGVSDDSLLAVVRREGGAARIAER
ncbi:MAG: hypothetical protein U0704_11665 [Candidatus Eisenbacteria bacterium]